MHVNKTDREEKPSAPIDALALLLESNPAIPRPIRARIVARLQQMEYLWPEPGDHALAVALRDVTERPTQLEPVTCVGDLRIPSAPQHRRFTVVLRWPSTRVQLDYVRSNGVRPARDHSLALTVTVLGRTQLLAVLASAEAIDRTILRSGDDLLRITEAQPDGAMGYSNDGDTALTIVSRTA